MNDVARSPETIFGQAIGIESPDHRRLFLEHACRGDTELRHLVEKLVDDHFRAGNFLEPPILDPAVSADVTIPVERPGTVIGPYKLLEQIGEGGMGVVFMAEQMHPVQRPVALKIIKPGMDTRQVIARFEAERQALAMMDHPNIAKVLDAGATNTGRPYFVMDLVKGVPITEYCDQRHLSVRQRLALVTQVCKAVQHAHQKGIIHRDLKPSNVLVAEYDGKPVPKIIDFGVAKATARKHSERTLFTEFGQVLGTIEYMSPEQAKLNQIDIDTRSDIYSLGVLLYELLAGSTPLKGQRLETVAFDETLRIIREVEPPSPSDRLNSLSLRSQTRRGDEGDGKKVSDELATIAANRQTEPSRLGKDVRGELDWIVMKCLEKDRNRRYESVGALAADISHHLADEPVTAGPPSRLYRAAKFVRRNRVPVVAALLIVAAILGGVAASAWQAVRATRAERAALVERDAKEQALRQAVASTDAERAAKEREADQRKKAEDISNFLITAFNMQYPEHDIQALAQVLKHSSEELQKVYSDDPNAHAAFLATMGRAHAGLRRYEDAEKMYRKCLEVASDPGLIDRVRHELNICLLRVGKSDEVLPMLQLDYLDKLKLAESPKANELLAILSGLPDDPVTADGNPGMDGLEFDGDGDYIIVPRIFFDGRPPWTLEAIVWPAAIDPSNPTSGSPEGWTSLISAASGGSIGLESVRQRWTIELYTAGIPGAQWTDNYASASARADVLLRQWQHVAGVWDGKELRLYVGGELQDTRTGVDYCSQLSLMPMFLGADPANVNYGEVAEGFLRGRLRAARISRSVEYTDSFPPPERLETTAGSIGLYDFTIDTGHYAIDRSGQGNHGIIIGAKYARSVIND